MPHMSPKGVHIAVKRAAHFRRRLAIVDGIPSEHSLMDRISFVAGIVRRTQDPDCWIVGLVVDEVVGRELIVYFNPATKEFKVQLPAEPAKAEPEKQPSTFPHALTNKGVRASNAYCYINEGKEYSLDEAGKRVELQRIHGWRWERK